MQDSHYNRGLPSLSLVGPRGIARVGDKLTTFQRERVRQYLPQLRDGETSEVDDESSAESRQGCSGNECGV